MGLEEIRNNRDMVNDIDWEMTPEEAVTLYLEWGNNWSHDRKMVKSKNDVSHYFVVNTWEEPPVIYLIKRNSEEAREIATILMPEDVKERFLENISHNKGVYGIDDDIRYWLENNLL